ncbi:MAG: methyltransferase domain-containing protein [Verrucomicrobiota bacterium]
MEKVDWNDQYVKKETPWDKGEPAPPLVEFLEENEISGRVLVPGCGRGHDVRALAAGGGAIVVGLDISPVAVEEAESFPRADGERYMVGDLFDPPPTFEGMFDLVFEHTCISAIPPAQRQDYAKQVTQCLKPGGKYLGIFFLNPWDEDEEPSPPPWGISVEEIDAMFAGRLEMVKEWRPSRAYPGREGRELLRLMVKSA